MHRGRLAAAAALAGVVLAACGGGDGGSDPAAEATGDHGGNQPLSSQQDEGERVPDMPIEAFDGSMVSLADYAGQPLLVNFWASWCAPCIAEMPDLEEVHQLTADQLGFVGINTQDTPDKAAELVEQTGVTYDLVRDPTGEFSQAFSVFGMPSTFFVDADGNIVGRHTGLLTKDSLLEALRENLGIETQATS